MKLKYDTRTWTSGLVVDAIAPGVSATDRKAASARLARWSDTGIIKTVGSPRPGQGKHRRYPASEVVLVAVAEALRPGRKSLAKVEHGIVALRSQLTDKPGDNPIDLAVDAVNGYTVDPHKTSITLIWTSNELGGAQMAARYCDRDELVQHPMSVNICLHHILKPLAGILASQGARASGGRKYRLDN